MATNNVVTASLTVSFEKQEVSGDGFLSWEVDDRSEEDGGLNGGDTSFSPGDTAYLLLFRESSVTLNETFTSGGSLVPSASNQIKSFKGLEAEYVTVTNNNTANLSKPANSGGVSLSWLGKSKKIGKGTPKLEMMKQENGTVSEVVIDLGTEMVGVIKAEYDSSATAYKLSGVPIDYPMAVVFATGTIQ